MKKLILIRHAHTVDNLKKVYSGFNNCELSEEGNYQVTKLTEKLKEYDIDQIFVSPLKRAVNTIEKTAKNKNIEMKYKDGIKEMNFGIFDGLTYKEIKKSHPEEVEKMFSQRDSYYFPEGESMDMFYTRVSCELKSIIKETPENTTSVICAHMGSIREMITYLLSKNQGLRWNFDVKNASITVIKIYEGFPIIEQMGVIPY